MQNIADLQAINACLDLADPMFFFPKSRGFGYRPTRFLPDSAEMYRDLC